MDSVSPENFSEGINEKDGFSSSDKMVSNSYLNIQECGLGGLKRDAEGPKSEMHVYTNDGYTSSPMPLCGVNGEGTQSSLMVSNLVGLFLPTTKSLETSEEAEPHLATDGADGKSSGCGTDTAGSPIKDCQKPNLPDADADADSGAILNNYAETEELNCHFNDPLDQGDNDHYDSVYNERHSGKFAPGEAENGETGKVSVYPQHDNNEVDEGIDDENLNKKPTQQNKIQEGSYSSKMVPPENVVMVWENSSLQSSQETRNVSLPPERRLSVSAEPAPQINSHPKGHTSPGMEILSPTNHNLKSAPSPNSSRRKHSTSPEKYGSGHKRTSLRDRTSPSAKRRSPSERASKREAQNRDDSPRRCSSRSLQKCDSPRRRGRSASKSPLRRRDSPGSHRGHRHPRSRSPIASDRHRRSPS